MHVKDIIDYLEYAGLADEFCYCNGERITNDDWYMYLYETVQREIDDLVFLGVGCGCFDCIDCREDAFVAAMKLLTRNHLDKLFGAETIQSECNKAGFVIGKFGDMYKEPVDLLLEYVYSVITIYRNCKYASSKI